MPIIQYKTEMGGHRAKFSVENIVSSVKLNQEIDIEMISTRFRDVNYNANKFPGINIRFKQPKCVVLLFKNGKMVITGLKYFDHVPIILDKVLEKLKNIGIVIKEKPDYEIVNIVSTLNFMQKINLDRASLELYSTIYEPEVFPGIIFRITEPKCVFLIFSSGKVVLTGLKFEKDIIPAIKILGRALKSRDLIKPLLDAKSH